MRHSFHSARILRYMRKPLISIVSTGAMLFFYPIHAFSAPTDGLVVKGTASITQSGTMTTIDQSTARAVIDWRGFDIGEAETVRFNQPGVNSVALNRVTGGNLTSILGMLSANGKIFITNPNGIVFGAGSKVDVAGLVATTLSIRNDDFMNGQNLFSQDLTKANSYVVNQGTIQIADNGYCFLVAQGVSNKGTIVAQLGQVVMASGKELTLDLNGDGMMTYTVSGKVLDSVIGPDDQPINIGVENSGTIQAKGGDIVLIGNAGADVFSSVVNNSGIIEATTLNVTKGQVVLSGGDEGIVANSGTIDVSGYGAGQIGGTVKLLGYKVGLFGGSVIDASGNAGGGTILVGGDYQGKNPDVLNASFTYVSSDAQIQADAIDSGDGGKVIIWADNVTRFYGSISARGGQLGGNGGFAEVSGKGYLEYGGYTDLQAPMGATGTQLLETANIEIGGNAAPEGDATSGDDVFGTGIRFSDNPDVISQIGAEQVGVMLDLSNLSLAATNDINVTQRVSWTSDNKLTLQAGQDIILSAEIYGGIGGIDLAADRDIDLRGSLKGAALSLKALTGSISQDAGVVVESSGGEVNLQAGGDISLQGQMNNLKGAVRITSGNNVTLVTVDDLDLQYASVNGDLSVTAGGAIRGGSDLKVGGAATFVTRKDAGADITLDSQSNQFGNLTARLLKLDGTTASSGSIRISESGQMNIDQIQTGGTVTLTAGSFTGLDHIVGMENLSLNANDGGIVLPGYSLVGTLNVTASGAITESGALSVSGAATFTAGAGNDITLDNGNDFIGDVTVVSGRNVSLHDVNAIKFGGTSMVSGTLGVTAGGAITDGAAGTLSVTSTTTLTAGGGNDITLDNGNNFGGALSIGSGSNNVMLNVIGDLKLGGVIAVGQVHMTAGGAITDANDAANNLTAASAVLNAGAGGIGANNALETVLGSVSFTTTGSARLSNQGALMASGTASGQVDLATTDNMNLSGAGISAGSGVRLEAGNLLAVDAPIRSGSGIMDLLGNNRVNQNANIELIGGSGQIFVYTHLQDYNANPAYKGGSIVMAPTSVTRDLGGSIEYTAANDIKIGTLEGATVKVTAVNGNVTGASSTSAIQANVATVQAIGGNIGASNTAPLRFSPTASQINLGFTGEAFIDSTTGAAIDPFITRLLTGSYSLTPFGALIQVPIYGGNLVILSSVARDAASQSSSYKQDAIVKVTRQVAVDMHSQASQNYSMTPGNLALIMSPSGVFAPNIAAVVLPQSAAEDRLELMSGGVIGLQP